MKGQTVARGGVRINAIFSVGVDVRKESPEHVYGRRKRAGNEEVENPERRE